ncbi:MAG: YqaJ viral recombinase family protein [Bacillota bacterium]|nr:YqaJ viral recombinase family protein [Bacillota bacterium]
MDIYTMEQGSPEWFKIKLGIVSAGSFSKVLAKGSGSTRKGYMLKLAAEILTGEHRETYSNADMARGTGQEPLARAEYEFITGKSVDQIGFAKNNRIGCSPDGLVGSEGGTEIKCVIAETQIETVLSNKIPSTHKAQIQGCMMVLDCLWFDFVSYSPLIKSKNYIFIKREFRDDAYIAVLESELIIFIKELDELVRKLR